MLTARRRGHGRALGLDGTGDGGAPSPLTSANSRHPPLSCGAYASPGPHPCPCPDPGHPSRGHRPCVDGGGGAGVRHLHRGRRRDPDHGDGHRPRHPSFGVSLS